MGRLRQFVKRIPGAHAAFVGLRRATHAARSFPSPFVRMFPAGHFYSPLPDIKQVIAEKATLFNKNVTDCPGVDLGAERQLAVLDELAKYYPEAPFSETEGHGTRYYYQNHFFKCGDGIVLYGMLRRLKPRNVVEVGSGFSSAAMLDTSDRFLQGQVNFTFVEPHPERLHSLLGDADRRRCKIYETRVQDVPLEIFDQLQADDVLFIDSSHVVKIGSDVRHLLWEVFPRLKAGVVVHVHDVQWPFEYPEDWVLEGNAWNEAYFMKAFLQYNSAFQIEYFNSYIAMVHGAALASKMPKCVEQSGGSLWLRKTA